MKKLFISVPMRGRTEENIKKTMDKMHKMAEIVFEQPLERIESYIPEHAPECNNERVWYLGESIKMLAEADYFIGFDNWEPYYPGCQIEAEVAQKYEIPSYFLNLYSPLTPDIPKILDTHYSVEPETLIAVERVEEQRCLLYLKAQIILEKQL